MDRFTRLLHTLIVETAKGLTCFGACFNAVEKSRHEQ